MNTRLQLYTETPPDIRSINIWLVQRLVELMRPFGISGITTKWTPMGVSGVLDVTLTEVERTPPGNFAVLQPKVARWIAEGLHMFGIQEVDTTPEAAELVELYRMWDAAGKPAADVPVAVEPQTVKMPPVVDPTNEHVLN